MNQPPLLTLNYHRDTFTENGSVWQESKRATRTGSATRLLSSCF